MNEQAITSTPAAAHVEQVQPALVVGIGASAGGLEAFQTLFRQVPSDCFLAFVLISHQDCNPKPLLGELLSKFSQLKVREIREEVHPEPNHVYVALPRHLVELRHGMLRTTPLDAEDRSFPLIDHFFHSLAEDRGERAVGIVLSGAGTDGTLGLKAINDAGGLTIAQTPESARYESMPLNAATTGVVDHVLPPEKIPSELLTYAENLIRLGTASGQQELAGAIGQAIPRIAEILQKEKRHDFQHYKISTLVRRVQRRMQVLHLSQLEEYIARLSGSRDEAEALFRELLIGVTSFFRDPDAFEALMRQVIPRLFENRAHKEPVRIWVPGCASGEEAYSIAMLVREELERRGESREVQIFATDIDERALSIARQGVYPLGIAEHVSAERLSRFFVKRNKRYHVTKELRELCLFSPHNLISDPPFSRQNLISCRNLLIYLGSHLQKKLVPLFHYALRPGGYLFLGPSENISSHQELFKPIDSKHRISQQKPTAVRSAGIPTRGILLRELSRNTDPSGDSTGEIPLVMQRIVLDEFAPKCIVVNAEGRVVCASGDMSNYLAVDSGPFQNNAVKMARPGLRVGLRSALREARKTKRRVVHDKLSICVPGGVQPVMITVQPMPQLGEDSELYLIVFSDVGKPVLRDEVKETFSDRDADTLIDQLERELARTREDLEKSIQDSEAVNEELKSSNEELLSMNEELRSANEELETSKEELQASHEALARADTDRENLFRSTRLAVIFLDDDLTVQSFTPAVAEIYNLLPADVGRPLAHITHRAISMPPLPDPRVLRGNERPIEHEVQLGDGTTLLRRVLLYQTQEGESEGMVITFTNVSQLKAAEQRASRLAAIVESSQDAIISKSLDGVITSWNRGAEMMYGWSAAEAIGRSIDLIIPEDRRNEPIALRARIRKGETINALETVRVTKDGRILNVSVMLSPVRDARGVITDISVITRDITQSKRAERALRESEAKLKSILANTTACVFAKNLEGRYIIANESFLELFGWRHEDEVLGQTDFDLHTREMAEQYVAHDRQVLEANEPRQYEEAARLPSGDRIYLMQKFPLRDGVGNVYGICGIATDITDRKKTEGALLRRARQQHAVAELGQLALGQRDMQKLFDRCTAVVTEVLENEYCKVLELLPEGDRLLLRAGVGWRQGLAGEAIVGAGLDSQAGYTLASKEPVVVEDLTTETRFSGPPLLIEHGVVSGMSCIIAGPDGRPWGVLGTHSRRKIFFTRDDVNFLLALANLISGAIQRHHSEERIVAESSLRHAIEEAIPDGIAACDRDGKQLYVNRALCEMLGWTAEELVGATPPYAYWPPEEIDAIQSAFEATLRGESPENGFELKFQRKSGEQFDVLVRIGEVDSPGLLTGWMASVTDITARKRAEDALRKEQRRLDLITNSLPVLISYIDRHRCYQFNNRAYEEWFRTTREELRGRHIRDVVGEAAYERLKPYLEAALGGETVEYEAEIPYRGSDPRIVRAVYVPHIDDRGKVQGLYALVTDVTAAKAAERSVRESEERLRSVINTAVDAILTIDERGIIESLNPAVTKLFGYSEEELIGRNVSVLMPERYGGEHDTYLSNYLSTGQPRIIGIGREVEGRRKDGSIFPIELAVSETHLEDRRIFTGIVRDVTARKRAESAVRESEERLRFTLNAAQVGAWDWNLQSGQVQWSDNLEAIHDRPAGSFGGTFDDVLREIYPPDRDQVRATIEAALAGDGQYEVEYRIVCQDGSLGWLHAQGRATFDDTGKPVRMAGICMDVTEQRRTAELTKLLAEAGAVLAGSLDYEAVLQAIAQLLVPSQGDWCGIDLVEGDQLRQVAVVHSDPQKVELAKELRRRYPPQPNQDRGTAKVIRTGKPEIYSEISDELLAAGAQDDEHVRIVRELGLKSAIVVPLAAGGEVYGAVTLVAAESNRRYGQRDVDFLQELASRCALRIQNAGLFAQARRELEERRQAETMLRQKTETLAAINHINMTLAGELELEKLVQAVTDAGTQLTGAEFGAFFHNVVDEKGETYQLVTLAGAPREEFSKLPLPRNTELFGPTFRGEWVIRLDNVTQDPRYGKSEPYYGIPPGHLPVRSYLAVPVTSRTGEVHGGLFFGHSNVGVFSEAHEQLVVGIAAQAAVAIDNARLYQSLQQELEVRRRAEEKLEQARQAAEVASRSKSEFLANMSHEIRTPMTAILGYTDVLRLHLQHPDDIHCVDTIRRNGEYLLEIIGDILDLSRIEAGKLRIEKQRFAPDELMAEVRSLMEVRAAEKGLALSVEYASLIPQTIESDSTRLRQILVNLIGNAVKFTETGSVRLIVRLISSGAEDGGARDAVVGTTGDVVNAGESGRTNGPEEGYLEFRVVDTGIGMSREQQEHLFEPFTQADSSVTRRYGGSGLGLSISQRLAEMLGGRISVRSELDKGSTFTLTVATGDLADVPLVEPRQDVLPRLADAATPRRLACRVLVVDDRREVRHVVQHFLEEAGAAVLAAGQGQEALDLVARSHEQGKPCDLILLDMQMPTMDGYEAAARLRQSGYEGPIIAITAHAMKGDKERCLQAGCDDYASKPIDRRKLIELVAHYTQDNSPLDLRKRRASLVQASRRTTPPMEESMNEPQEGRRILVIDDSQDACRALQLLLATKGHDVAVAQTGRAGLEAARQHRPEVVLLDLGLPDITGYDVARKLREMDETRQVLLIAVSGHNAPEDVQRSQEAGCDHHVVKPAPITQLEELIENRGGP